MANSVNPDQTAPIGAVCSGSTLFPTIPNWSVMLDNYLQQTTSADDIFRYIFFLALYGLKCRSRLKQTTNFVKSFLIFQKQGIIFHVNHLPADDSHEISCLICYF